MTENESKTINKVMVVWHKKKFFWGVFSVNYCGLCAKFGIENLESGKKPIDSAKSCLRRFNLGPLLLFGGMQKIFFLVIPQRDMHLACG